MRKYKSLVISGNPVSGKSSLSTALAKEYGWKIFSVGQLWREKWRELYPKGDVKFEDYWGSTSLDENKAMNIEAKTIIEEGDIIADSRFCSYLDPTKCLIVFVTADIEARARMAKNRHEYGKLDVAAVKKILMKREEDEVRMGKDLFGVDYRNPKLYHAVINSGLLTVDQELEIIRGLMK